MISTTEVKDIYQLLMVRVRVLRLRIVVTSHVLAPSI